MRTKVQKAGAVLGIIYGVVVAIGGDLWAGGFIVSLVALWLCLLDSPPQGEP